MTKPLLSYARWHELLAKTVWTEEERLEFVRGEIDVEEFNRAHKAQGVKRDE